MSLTMQSSEPSTQEGEAADEAFTPPAEPTVPVELELGDGSRLVLEQAGSSPIVCRVDGRDCERITLDDAMRLSGEPFAGYRYLGRES